MKILHIISSLEIGGAQRLLSDILPLLAKDNQVALLVNKEVDNNFTHRVKDGGVDILSLNLPNLYSIKNLIALRKAMRGYDVVHVHLFPSIYWAAMASLFCKARLVYTEHSTSNKRRGKWYLRPIEWFIYSRYKRIISISEQTQKTLMNWLGAHEGDKRFVVVNNGTNLSAFQEVRREKIYPHSLIMVSRFAASKDQKTVIRALALLTEDVHVIFVGDGERFEECKAEAEKLGVSGRTHFVGRQADVASWLRKADIGIQSSNWEGFGLTAVEMMADGLPVIATNVDGLKQVIEGAGLLFPVGDEKVLAGHVERLISDGDFYKKLSEASKAKASLYDISKTAEQYMKIYKEIVGQ
ncbi:MAG: glycosyltransferase family 4 protein [Prevotella sp.]|nr:glycosyltransferase family 4 protein [Prevotella sp.]